MSAVLPDLNEMARQLAQKRLEFRVALDDLNRAQMARDGAAACVLAAEVALAEAGEQVAAAEQLRLTNGVGVFGREAP